MAVRMEKSAHNKKGSGDMSYIQDSLSAGEEIERDFALHWFVWVPTVIWFILGFVTLGLTWLIAIYEVLRIKNLEYGLTNKRVISKTGIISRKSEEMKLRAIETIEINQGIFGRIFGFGTVRVTGRGTSAVELKGIVDPVRAKRDVESIADVD